MCSFVSSFSQAFILPLVSRYVHVGKLIQLLAVFIVAFYLGGFASFYILSEYVIDVKAIH